MKVEIWSDVMCPFCYIGKRKFEQALNDFGHKDEVEVEWKSFQLDPDLETDPKKNVNQMLAEKKGWTIDYARQMNANVTNIAKEVGLSYNFDTAIVANSFDAHRLVHLAKKSHLGAVAEERLFRAYFTEGKNIADHATLIQLGTDIGLEREEVKQLLESGACADEVEMDKYEARKAGVRGVPFFLLDNKYAVSGAQSPQTFLNALQTAWAEIEK
jgi:predicted DsbA family dithiol-disulfide isomerase